MYQIDFTKPQSVHFVGIGGISMSGLAEILMDEGFKISGSDAHESELTRHLEAKGAVGNIRVGGPEFFVTEACEYTNSFLSFYPTMAVILNIEEDHLDFFKDIDDIRRSFRQFIEKVPENGTIIMNGTIENWRELTALTRLCMMNMQGLLLIFI